MNETIGKSELVDRVAWAILNGFCAAHGLLPIRDTEFVEDSGGHRIWGYKAKLPDGIELTGLRDKFGEYLYSVGKLFGEKYNFHPFMVSAYFYTELGAYINLAVEQNATLSAQ